MKRAFRLWKRGHVYYYQLPGDTSYHSTGNDSKMRAIDFVYGQLQKGKATDRTFYEYAEPFFKWADCPRVTRLRDEGKSIGRVHVAKSRRWLELRVFPDKLFSNLPIKEITRGDILDLRKRLRGEVGPNTLNKVIATVKTILSEANYRGDIPNNPGARVGNIKYEQAQRGVFSVEEVSEILTKRPGEMKSNRLVDVFVTTLLCTGIRVGELRALRWWAIDFETGRTRITEAFKGENEIGDPKWGKKREIAFPDLLLDRLRKWHVSSRYNEADDFVFTEIDGQAVGQTWIRKNLLRVLSSADMSEALAFKIGERWLTPHACRHTLNTHLLSAGVPPLLVQTYLGWSSQEQRILTAVQRTYTELRLFRIEDVAHEIDELYGVKKRARRVAVATR